MARFAIKVPCARIAEELARAALSEPMRIEGIGNGFGDRVLARAGIATQIALFWARNDKRACLLIEPMKRMGHQAYLSKIFRIIITQKERLPMPTGALFVERIRASISTRMRACEIHRDDGLVRCACGLHSAQQAV